MSAKTPLRVSQDSSSTPSAKTSILSSRFSPVPSPRSTAHCRRRCPTVSCCSSGLIPATLASTARISSRCFRAPTSSENCKADGINRSGGRSDSFTLAASRVLRTIGIESPALAATAVRSHASSGRCTAAAAIANTWTGVCRKAPRLWTHWNLTRSSLAGSFSKAVTRSRRRSSPEKRYSASRAAVSRTRGCRSDRALEISSAARAPTASISHRDRTRACGVRPDSDIRRSAGANDVSRRSSNSRAAVSRTQTLDDDRCATSVSLSADERCGLRTACRGSSLRGTIR